MKASKIKRPLVALARSEEGNRELESELRAFGFSTLSVETVEFLPPTDWREVDDALRGLKGFDWVLITSPRAADALAARLDALGLVVMGAPPRFGAVGPSTAARLRSHGIEVNYVPPEYLTSALGRGVPATRGQRLLLLRADISDRRLASALRKRGMEVLDLAAYRTRTVGGKAGSKGMEEADAVVFASPSEVRGFVERMPPKTFESIRMGSKALCIGPVTAKAAEEAGFRRVSSPREHTVEALVRLVMEGSLDA